MNRTIGCAAGVMFLSIALTGCETYKPTRSSTPLPVLKRAGIQVEPNSNEKKKRADDIATALRIRGIEPILVQPGQPIPKDVDGYFTYNTKWEWDLTMYLDEMRISLHEPGTSRSISSARYTQGWIHRYPEPLEVVEKLISLVLEDPPTTETTSKEKSK